MLIAVTGNTIKGRAMTHFCNDINSQELYPFVDIESFGFGWL